MSADRGVRRRFVEPAAACDASRVDATVAPRGVDKAMNVLEHQQRRLLAAIDGNRELDRKIADNGHRRRENMDVVERRMLAGEELAQAEVHAVLERHQRLIDELRAIDRGLLGG